MTIEKPFEWLFNRFKQPQIKPCKFDIECLTFLAEWVNREKEKNKQENVLFAKLYVYVFLQEIRHFKDIEFAKKSVNDLLTLKLEKHYEIFRLGLNELGFNNYLRSIDIDPETRYFIDAEGYSEDLEKLKQAEAFFENVDKWQPNQIERSLNATITEAINRFDNLP